MDKEVGQFDGQKFEITDGPNWIVAPDGNVYEEGGASLKGRLGDDNTIASTTGEIQYTIGQPLSEE